MSEILNPVKSPRVEAIDALRGFAVMAIALLHNIEHFIYNVYPTDSSPMLAAADTAVHDAVFFVFAGKSYAIFALLFGFTYWIQYSNRQRAGDDFAGRYAWRLLWLLAFGTLNALFFPGGDVLVLFAITGLFLIPVRKLSNGWVLAAAIVLLAQPVELYRAVQLIFNPDYALPVPMAGPLYGEVGQATQSGSWWELFRANIWTGQKASLFWALDGGRFWQTPGLFMIGFLLAKTGRFVSSGANLNFWARVFVGSFLGALGLWVLNVSLGSLGSPELAGVLKNVCTMWYNAAFTGLLVAAFMLLYETEAFRRMTGPLRDYGRTSLTNYVSQSMLGALIYFPVGLNLAPHIGMAGSVLVGVGMIAIQVWFCRWWLRRHRMGLLEGLWHRLTWVKMGK